VCNIAFSPPLSGDLLISYRMRRFFVFLKKKFFFVVKRDRKRSFFGARVTRSFVCSSSFINDEERIYNAGSDRGKCRENSSGNDEGREVKQFRVRE